MIRTAIFTLILTAAFGILNISANAQGCTSMLGVQSAGCNTTGQTKPGVTPTVSGKLYFQQGGQFYANFYGYANSHFEAYPADGSVIKTYKDSCKPAKSNGVDGLVCSFGHFYNGQVIYSGWVYIFQNGVVYIRWMYQFVAGVQTTKDTGWVQFQAR